MTNWKTTIAGAIGAGALTLQALFATGTVDWKTAITAVIVAVIGFVAKDAGISGTTK